MYTPPPKTVLQQLTQGVMETITFGMYVIHIGFDNGNRLSFSALFRFGPTEQFTELSINEFPLSESKLIRILGCSVTDVMCEEDGTLNLVFSNGDAISIYANNPMYEAYTLLIAGREYVV